nr:putative ribonuclease H-like domain-containing protein [Tanacetum cinerariifolium]
MQTVISELKQIEADDQAIQTILLGLLEDIYAAVDSYETTQEIWLRVQQMMKGSDIGIHKKKAKLFNEWERRMILEPGDTNREVPVNETFHVQTDDELTEKELKQIEADDQDIQTILLGLPEDIYTAEKKAKLFNEWERFTSNKGESIESYYHRFLKLMNDLKQNKHFPKKISSNLKFLNNLKPEWSRHVTIVHQTKDLHTVDYTQLYDFLKYNQKEVDELKAERLAKIQDPLALMANSNNPYAFPAPHQDQPSFNQNYMQQPTPNSDDIIDPITVINMALILMAKAFKLNYSTPTNNNQRISLNTRNRQIAQPGMNMGQDRQTQMVGGNGENQFRQYAGQNVRNLNGYNAVQNVRNQVAQNPRVQNVGNQNRLIGVPGNANQNGNGNLVVACAEGNAAGHNGNQIRCYNCRGVGHFARNCTIRPRRRDAAYLQTQLLTAQKEEAGIQLQAEEMTLETHNWSSLAHQELHKIEATKFVGDFKSLAKEADDSLAKHKALELEIERLLRAVDSQDIMSAVQKESVVDTSNLQTKLERTKERFENCIIKRRMNTLNFGMIGTKSSIMGKLPKVGALSKPVTSNSTATPQESKVMQNDKVIALGLFRINPFKTYREEKHVPNTVITSARTKPITVSQPSVITKKDVNSDSNGLSSTGIDNTKTRRPQPRSNTKMIWSPLRLRVCLISVNHDVCLRNYVKGKTSRGKKQKANVSIKEKQKKHQPKAKQTKKVGFIERLATPKPSKTRFLLRWSPTGRMFDQKGKIVDSSEFESHLTALMVIQICLWCVDSGCSKHMTGNLKLLINFVWKFMGIVLFGNDHVAVILDFGDLQWGNILITRVYFVEGLGYNLFSVGQFCDSDLEVAFRRNACFVRNLDRVDLLKGDRSTNLYTINLHEMASASPICLMARTSSTKSWLWHQRLSHLNFDTINDLAKNDLVSGLLKFKYHKEHLCPSCEQGKSKRAPHPPKPVPNSRQRLHLLHMDLCGPMRIASINVLKEYFDSVGISYQMSSIRTPQQNGVVEHKNRTLVEAARTMLIFSHAPLFLWAEAIATACFTQNRFIIHCHFNKTPYELINGRKSDISFLHVFGALCYPKNDREDIGKLGAKGDIGFFIGYSADSCAYRILNRRTKKIMKTMNVSFDELSVMAFEQCSLKPELQSELDLLFEAMYDDYISGQPSATARSVLAAKEPQVHQTSMTSTTIADTAPTPTNSSSQATIFPNTSEDVDELTSQQQHVQQQGSQAYLQSKIAVDNVSNAMFDANTFVNPFANPSTSAAESSSSQNMDPSNMHTNQLRSDGDMSLYALTVSTMEPKNVKEAMIDPAWIELIQEELLQFKNLDVWVLVPTPDNISPLTLKWLLKNKHDEEQTVIQNKSRLVVRGYRQKEGIDFKESFASQTMKGSDIGIQEKKAKLFNEWEMFTSTNGESIESYYHQWSRLVTIVHQTKDFHTADYTQLYDFLKYNQKEVDDLKAERLTRTQDPLALMATSNNPYTFPVLNQARAEGNATGQNGNQIKCYNCIEVGHFARNCIVRPRRRDAAYLQTQLLIAQKEEARIQLQAEEFDLMDAAADLDEIGEVNANYILMANLQQALTSSTQTDKAPVYDSDGSVEVHNYENCYDNEIFNMFTQEEQYTELLEPIPEPHQVPQNDNNVIFE